MIILLWCKKRGKIVLAAYHKSDIFNINDTRTDESTIWTFAAISQKWFIVVYIININVFQCGLL